jgi:hypothetical protein
MFRSWLRSLRRLFRRCMQHAAVMQQTCSIPVLTGTKFRTYLWYQTLYVKFMVKLCLYFLM